MNRTDEGAAGAVAGQADAQESRQHDPAACPAWCSGEHLHQALSATFQHDGDAATLWITGPEASGEQRVSVVPTAADCGGSVLPAHVELHIDETICVLTPAQALQVADWLRETAELLSSARPHPA